MAWSKTLYGLLAVAIVHACLVPLAFAAVPAIFSSSVRLSDPTDAVSYESVQGSDLPSLLFDPTRHDSIFSSFAEERPGVVLVFLGKEIRTIDLSSPAGSVESLKSLLSESVTSKVFPYVQPLTQAAKGHVLDSLLESFFSVAYAGDALVSDSCGAVSRQRVLRFGDDAALQELLTIRASVRAIGELDMVLSCSEAASDAAETHNNAVAAETAELSSLATLIKTITPNFAFFYTPLPDTDLGAQRRLLAAADDYAAAGAGAGAAGAGAGDAAAAAAGFDAAGAGAAGEELEGKKKKKKCGPTCKTRAALLEGLFAGIVMLVILVSGLTVLSQIDTPTRFEVAHEAS